MYAHKGTDYFDAVGIFPYICIMKRSYIIILTVAALVVFAVLAFVFYPSSNLEHTDNIIYEEEAEECRLVYGLPIDSFRIVAEKIKPNTYLSQLFSEIGVSREFIAQLNTLDRSAFDVRSIRTGQPHKALYHKQDTTVSCPAYWVYEKSLTEYVVFCFGDSMRIYSGTKPTQIETRTVHAEITSSLWNATVDNGLPPSFAIELSDIYSWTIDFFGLQRGDHFSAVYDCIYVDSTLVGIGSIHAALFNSSSKDIYAIAFEQDSTWGYFDQDGQSLKRAFLKAPLNYSRISSHFSYSRMHPVHRVVRPHTGVDYAAPAGTPVVSIGDGVVVEKGYKGGGGNTVKIRHNSVYTTAYLHLSKFGAGVQVGAKVSQGQVIGYVGSTGTSTGPHLDFRVWMNGKPINPLSMESPPVEPINEQYRHEFDSVKAVYIPLLRKDQPEDNPVHEETL